MLDLGWLAIATAVTLEAGYTVYALSCSTLNESPADRTAWLYDDSLA